MLAEYGTGLADIENADVLDYQVNPKKSCDESYVVTLANGFIGVFKPSCGESVSQTSRYPGGFYKRERAAYLVSLHLGTGLVPLTVIRKVHGKIGSLQEFIHDCVHYFEIRRDAATLHSIWAQLYTLWGFDYIIWNSDRNAANALFADAKIWAIDNGASFGSRDYLFTLRKYFQEPAPNTFINTLRGFLDDTGRTGLLTEDLAAVLPQEDFSACLARIEHLGNKLSQKGLVEDEDSLPYRPQRRLWRMFYK